jgi:amino-acid N-acetyltransferase
MTAAEGLTIGGEIRRQISMEELQSTLEKKPGAIELIQQSKARQAVRAISGGVPRVHIIDGRLHDALLNEIFSNEGVGTLVYGNDYQQIRKATKRDIRLIHNLTRHAVKRAELVHRTLESVEKNIDSFYVFEIDENLIGCVSLATYPDKPGLMELGSLFVQPFHSKQGIGKKLVAFACHEAKANGAKEVLALSTQTFAFFTDVCGFSEAGIEILPESRRVTYEQSQRNSRILHKTL